VAKKKVVVKYSIAERRLMVEKDDRFSIQEQCEMVSIHRSGFYYSPKGETAMNLEIMRLIDAYFLEHPHSGVITVCAYLCFTKGYCINVKRVRRLMRLMGLMAVYPSKKLSIANKEHTIYPYLLRGLKIERRNQVWQTDITYVPMKKGFMYMMAIIDVKSRFILNWSVSNTMDAAWCTKVLQETLELHGKPEIFNTDQGSQFTSHEFQQVLTDLEIKISMDGKGRALDNIYIERFWRSLKYEHVYLKPAEDGLELFKGIKQYIEFYNRERRHQSLDLQTPTACYAPLAA
jgi:putative transposase